MGLDWPYPAKRTKQHHSPVPDLEPQGKRRGGRPKNSWRRDTDAELKIMGYTWKEAVQKAQGRARWRGVVNGLCSTWSDGPNQLFLRRTPSGSAATVRLREVSAL
ncbi:hypothetical protein ACROYT_G020271 [Oculina patagonica]